MHVTHNYNFVCPVCRKESVIDISLYPHEWGFTDPGAALDTYDHNEVMKITCEHCDSKQEIQIEVDITITHIGHPETPVASKQVISPNQISLITGEPIGDEEARRLNYLEIQKQSK